MAETNSLKVLEVTQVAPPDSVTEFSLPLTYLDTFWFKFHPVERLFFYSFNDSHYLTDSFMPSNIIPKLRHSLTLTLQYYPIMSGNITWPSYSPKPIVLYTPGDSVSLTIAESTADFNLLASNHVPEASESRHLVPLLSISQIGASALALRITFFPKIGFCIGISCHHSVLDGKSTILFMKSWAYINRESDSPSLPVDLIPFYDRSSIKDPTGLDLVYVKKWLELTGSDMDSRENIFEFFPMQVPPNLTRATFELTRKDVEKLRKRVLNEWEKVEKTELNLSSFVLTFAYGLVCKIRASEAESNRKVYVGFPADARNRLDPPVPVNYFGNCVGSVLVFNGLEKREFMKEDALVYVAATISRSIKDLKKKSLERGGMEVLSIFTSIEPTESLVIGVAGSPRFGVYEIDFGWGRPNKVEVTSIEDGSMYLTESRDGSGGIEIGVVLKKLEFQHFSSLFHSGLTEILN